MWQIDFYLFWNHDIEYFGISNEIYMQLWIKIYLFKDKIINKFW